MGVDDTANDIQISGAEAVATSQLDRVEPELAGPVLSLDVHVRRLITVEAGKKTRYGPGMPLILGIQRCSLLSPFARAIVSCEPGRCLRENKTSNVRYQPRPKGVGRMPWFGA
jgi:hypothetical protein